MRQSEGTGLMAYPYGEVPQMHFTAEVKLNLGDYQSASVSFGLSRVPIDVTPEQFEQMLDGVVVDMLGRVNDRVRGAVVERLRSVLGPYAENHELVRQYNEDATERTERRPPPRHGPSGEQGYENQSLTDRQKNLIGAMLKDLWPDGAEARLALMRLLADGGHIPEHRVASLRIEDFDKRLASTAIDVIKGASGADMAGAFERASVQGRFE
ncbi:MAG: hypothetical protein KF884_10810 [Fimbriimonadaceae bacterium]|nr:hypothetical protein [Fimbriimonadaceae bacterium]QYK58037.1 MAG: hypothetical protein KF884_10810 [Fimbriimonadaceae bacterium]